MFRHVLPIGRYWIFAMPFRYNSLASRRRLNTPYISQWRGCSIRRCLVPHFHGVVQAEGCTQEVFRMQCFFVVFNAHLFQLAQIVRKHLHVDVVPLLCIYYVYAKKEFHTTVSRRWFVHASSDGTTDFSKQMLLHISCND